MNFFLFINITRTVLVWIFQNSDFSRKKSEAKLFEVKHDNFCKRKIKKHNWIAKAQIKVVIWKSILFIRRGKDIDWIYSSTGFVLFWKWTRLEEMHWKTVIWSLQLCFNTIRFTAPTCQINENQNWFLERCVWNIFFLQFLWNVKINDTMLKTSQDFFLYVPKQFQTANQNQFIGFPPCGCCKNQYFESNSKILLKMCWIAFGEYLGGFYMTSSRIVPQPAI